MARTQGKTGSAGDDASVRVKLAMVDRVGAVMPLGLYMAMLSLCSCSLESIE